MPKKRLTDHFVATVRPVTTDTKFRDTVIRGLVLRVHATGSKSYMIERVINYQTVRQLSNNN